MNITNRASALLAISLAGLLLVTATPAVHAEDAADREFKFMSGLVDWDLGDYAEKALKKLLLKRPDLKDRAKVIQAEILLSRGKPEEAEALADTLPKGSPKADSIRLAIANRYYRSGDLDQARKLYDAFFAQYGDRPPEDTDLRRFFQESSYRYAQMLENAGDEEGAAKAYDRVLLSKPGREVERPLMAEQAQLYAELGCRSQGAKRDQFLKRAQALSEELLWGGLDIWFGKSIVTVAHAKICEGDSKAAATYLTENMDILKGIDEAMVKQGVSLAESPMAGARYLRAEIWRDQGNAAEGGGQKQAAQDALVKALKEFYNVFSKYPDSDWGAKAGGEAALVKERLEGEPYNKQIKIKNLPGGGKLKVGPEQFRLADTLFQQKKYQEALVEYLKLINQFPESDQTPRVLSNMVKAYKALGDDLSVKMLVAYLGERFRGNGEAARALLQTGKLYFDAGNEGMYMRAYETYLADFPEDDKAAAILFTLAQLRKKAGDEEGRMKYLQQLVTNYKGDKQYVMALKQLAWDSYLAEAFGEAVGEFKTYIKEAQPGSDKAKAQFALADSHFRQGAYIKAAKAYATLVKWLDPKRANNPFNTSAEAKKKNDDVLEKARFQLANAFSQIKAPGEKQAAIQARALKGFDEFLTTYPKSALAPKAMASKGRLQLTMGQFDEATQTFNKLASLYPESEEGKDALYSLIKAAMEVDKVDVARSAFAKMLANKSEYGPRKFARVGNLMIDVGAYEEAAQAFSQIPGTTGERVLLERSLYGLGRASFELKRYDDAIKSLSDLMERYPQSGLFYKAKGTLADAYLATDRFDEGIEALTDIFRYAKDEVTRNEASFKLGEIYRKQGDLEKSYASFQRIALLADPGNKALHPVLSKAMLAAIDLGVELKRWPDVLESCDGFLKTFPRSEEVGRIRRIKRDAQLKVVEQGVPAEVTAP